jgi:hypothetical protein
MVLARAVNNVTYQACGPAGTGLFRWIEAGGACPTLP